MEYNKMPTEAIVDLLCDLEERKGNLSQEIAQAQAEVQARGLRVLEDRNIKSTEFYGNEGNYATVTVAQKLDVLNYGRLINLIGESLAKEKTSLTYEPKYTFHLAFKRALIACYMNDFEADMTVDALLIKQFPQLTGQQVTLLVKKMKGDYKKDKAVLRSVLGEDAELDEELFFIYKIKNFELMKAFIDENELERYRDELKKCIAVDETPKIAVKFDKEV